MTPDIPLKKKQRRSFIKVTDRFSNMENQGAELNKMQEIMQLQQMHQQMEDLSKQLEDLQEKQTSISITINAIQELKKTQKGEEILVPIADGIFVKTTLCDNSVAIVNIGKGITVEKPLDEVIEMVQGHETTIQESSVKLEEKMQEVSHNLLEKITTLEMTESKIKE